MKNIRDRIKELRRVKAKDLHPSIKNWRKHPDSQRRAMQGVLNEVGYVDALLCRETKAGLEIIDGHLRAEITPDAEVPVLILDVDESEADKILATFDPIAAMVEADKDKLDELIQSLSVEDSAVKEMLDGLASEGFRPNQGHLKNTITDWKNADHFFDCPEEVKQTLENRKILIVQFSGGKDSLATLLWVCKNFTHKEIHAVFTDPGVEFPGMGAYVGETCERLGVTSEIVKPAEEWWEWLRKNGEWPSLLFRPCASRMIHAPFAKWVKALPPEEVALFTGSRAEEAVRGSTKTDRSVLSSLGKSASKYYHYAPCFYATKSTLDQVLSESGVPLWPGYARGFVRTACWCCPGMCGRQALALQNNYPGLADEIRSWEKRIGPMRPHENGRCFDDILCAGKQQAAKQLSP